MSVMTVGGLVFSSDPRQCCHELFNIFDYSNSCVIQYSYLFKFQLVIFQKLNIFGIPYLMIIQFQNIFNIHICSFSKNQMLFELFQ